MKMISKAGAAMTKGSRSFGSASFHERFLGSYGYVPDHAGAGAGDLSELGEEDVWPMAAGPEHEYEDKRGYGGRSESEFEGRNGPSQVSFLGGEQGWISNGGRQVGGLSLAFEDAGNRGSPRIIHQRRAPEGGSSSKAAVSASRVTGSAPVNVPNWPRMMRVESTGALHEGNDSWVDEADEERMPPHEYLAREYAQSQRAAATSVLEGMGRTLKGRDMSRVRDAVWSQTGFFG